MPADPPRDRDELQEAIAHAMLGTIGVWEAADAVLSVLDQAGVLCPHEPTREMVFASTATSRRVMLMRSIAASPFAKQEPPRE